MNANFTQNPIMSTLTVEQVFAHRNWIYEQQTGVMTHERDIFGHIRTRETRSAK